MEDVVQGDGGYELEHVVFLFLDAFVAEVDEEEAEDEDGDHEDQDGVVQGV